MIIMCSKIRHRYQHKFTCGPEVFSLHFIFMSCFVWCVVMCFTYLHCSYVMRILFFLLVSSLGNF